MLLVELTQQVSSIRKTYKVSLNACVNLLMQDFFFFHSRALIEQTSKGNWINMLKLVEVVKECTYSIWKHT